MGCFVCLNHHATFCRLQSDHGRVCRPFKDLSYLEWRCLHRLRVGFSPRTNRYKVIRIFSQWRPTDPFFLRWHESTVAEVHTLGTGSWRRIGKVLYSRENKLAFPTYLNGHLHWLFKNPNGPDSIVSFELDTEQFHSVPLPRPLQWGIRHFMSFKRLSLCMYCLEWA